MTVDLTFEIVCQRAKRRPENPPWKVDYIKARIPIVRINENAGQVNLPMNVCIDVWMRVRVYVCTYMYLHTDVYTFVLMCMCMHLHVWGHMLMYLYLFLHMRVHFQVDFSVDNDLPIFKSQLLLEYTQFDPRYPALVRALSLSRLLIFCLPLSLSVSLSLARARSPAFSHTNAHNSTRGIQL